MSENDSSEIIGNKRKRVYHSKSNENKSNQKIISKKYKLGKKSKKKITSNKYNKAKKC